MQQLLKSKKLLRQLVVADMKKTSVPGSFPLTPGVKGTGIWRICLSAQQIFSLTCLCQCSKTWEILQRYQKAVASIR